MAMSDRSSNSSTDKSAHTPATSTCAPIALFAFQRPDHTLRVLNALSRNPEFERSHVHVFCDGARRQDEVAAVEQTRHIVRTFAHPNLTLIAAPANRGLAKSITAGVNSLCEQYGRVIVVEDDLLVSSTFLGYMNRALDRYANESRVMQVSGHMFPVDLAKSADSVLLPFTTSWGWATWRRAWDLFDASATDVGNLDTSMADRVRFDLGGSYPYFQMLQRQASGEVDSWAIRWYLAVYRHSGLVLFPRTSLVENIGFDGSGTHCAEEDVIPTRTLSQEALGVETANSIAVDEEAFRRIRKYLRKQRSAVGLIGDWKSRLLPASPGKRSHAR